MVGGVVDLHRAAARQRHAFGGERLEGASRGRFERLERDRGEVRVVIDLTHELTAWLRSTDARTLMKEIVAEAVQSEIRSALEDELIDVEGAAAMLDMTEGALRKAVERGQVPCQRVGNRLRFRRSDLMRDSRAPNANVAAPGPRDRLADRGQREAAKSNPARARKIAS